MRLFLTRGWGNHGKKDADFSFLEQLLDEDAPLQRWRVMAGGEGYAQIYVDSGTDLDDFLGYCAGELEAQLSSDEIETVLRALVEAPEMNGKYRLGQSAIKHGRLNFPVTYASPITFEQWEARTSEIYGDFRRFAVEVCDICHVRTSSSCDFTHDPQTKTSAGGSISIHLRSN